MLHGLNQNLLEELYQKTGSFIQQAVKSMNEFSSTIRIPYIIHIQKYHTLHIFTPKIFQWSIKIISMLLQQL